ncbi:ATP-dependent sacrificial sulfur transferase LarE [Tunturiibacter gelidiferens]|uniref:ATP-dependent sacrificial sulfur transferase LarE n=1 Tax=Tunturiibacter gelidiferens TaxID=3069689 RepID=A0AAU7YX14_9BACT
MDLAAKSAKLHSTLQQLGSVLVAYSGGTDSAYLAYAAHQALGENMQAVIADSASLPRAELAAALAFAADHNIPIQILRTNELDNPEYQRNDAHRCFHCKDELFQQMEQARATRNFAHIAYGMNLDDRAEFRPGQQAAAQHHAVAPLVTASLTKQEIRTLAQQSGLNLWDKPASACLSSRIEYGRPVTRENLSQVEQAEEALHALGFPQVRVRHHGDLARIEIARADLPRALSLPTLEAITAAIKPLGFLYVTLDTEGYRSGSMNDTLLAASSILPAAR